MHTLYLNISKEQLPIIYRKEYNVKFCGLEKLHPFDTKKYGHVFKVSNLYILAIKILVKIKAGFMLLRRNLIIIVAASI